MSTAATVLSSFSVKNGISDICRFRRVILSPDNTEVKLLWKFLPATYGRVLSLLLFAVSCYRYLGDGGTNRRETLHDGIHRSRTGLFPIW